MQNSSIIYHSESILETQILCLIASSLAQVNLGQEQKNLLSQNGFLMGALLWEHIFSYAFHLFRVHDIKYNCKIDINGVKRAPRESLLQSVEIFFDCMLIGYVIKHLSEIDSKTFHEEAYNTYWIIIDCFLLFLTQGYNYLCELMKTKSEVTKNVFSLHFVQRQKIEEMRIKVI